MMGEPGSVAGWAGTLGVLMQLHPKAERGDITMPLIIVFFSRRH